MIVVTRLNDSRFAVNPDLIERIHASPDTTLVTVDGSSYIIAESMSDVIDMIADYRARVLARAQDMRSNGQYGVVRELAPVTEPGVVPIRRT